MVTGGEMPPVFILSWDVVAKGIVTVVSLLLHNNSFECIKYIDKNDIDNLTLYHYNTYKQL